MEFEFDMNQYIKDMNNLKSRNPIIGWLCDFHLCHMDIANGVYKKTTEISFEEEKELMKNAVHCIYDRDLDSITPLSGKYKRAITKMIFGDIILNSFYSYKTGKIIYEKYEYVNTDIDKDLVQGRVIKVDEFNMLNLTEMLANKNTTFKEESINEVDYINFNKNLIEDRPQFYIMDKSHRIDNKPLLATKPKHSNDSTYFIYSLFEGDVIICRDKDGFKKYTVVLK